MSILTFTLVGKNLLKWLVLQIVWAFGCSFEVWTQLISKHQNFLKDLNLISANVPVSHILSDAVFPAVLIGMLFPGGASAAL